MLTMKAANTRLAPLRPRRQRRLGRMTPIEYETINKAAQVA